MVYTIFERKFASFQDILCYVTEEDRTRRNAETPEHAVFIDIVAQNLCVPDAFVLPTGHPAKQDFIAYNSVNDDPVEIVDITHNYLTRSLYENTRPGFSSRQVFNMLKLAGVPLPDQVIVTAATLPNVVSDVSPGMKFSSFQFLLSIGFSVLRDNKVISDDFGNSIFSVVSQDNAKRLLRSLALSGVKTLQLSLAEYLHLRDSSAKAQKALNEFHITII